MAARTNQQTATPLSPITEWAALAGAWGFSQGEATYSPAGQGRTGRSAHTGAMPYGLALSSVHLRDGAIQADVTLRSQKDTSAGIVLGFNAEAKTYVAVLLGGWNSAYAISETDESAGWRALNTAGSLSNLQPDQAYRVRVIQQGQKVTLEVDQVRIFEHVLSKPLPGNQIGLLAWGSFAVEFKAISFSAEQPRAFVAMPFTEPFDTLYQHVIRPEAQQQNFDVLRIDELAKPGLIFEDIKREIAEAKVVIAEVTASNPNVYYELGYAHALNKPTILLAQKGKDLPFDISGHRVIFYDDSIGGKPTVEASLRHHLSAILKDL